MATADFGPVEGIPKNGAYQTAPGKKKAPLGIRLSAHAFFPIEPPSPPAPPCPSPPPPPTPSTTNTPTAPAPYFTHPAPHRRRDRVLTPFARWRLDAMGARDAHQLAPRHARAVARRLRGLCQELARVVMRPQSGVFHSTARPPLPPTPPGLPLTPLTTPWFEKKKTKIKHNSCKSLKIYACQAFAQLPKPPAYPGGFAPRTPRPPWLGN